jgi:hypothetical protein
VRVVAVCHGLAKKEFGGFPVSYVGRIKVNCLAMAIDGSKQVHPPPAIRTKVSSIRQSRIYPSDDGAATG